MRVKKEVICILLMAMTMLLNACSSDESGAQTVTTGEEPVGKQVQLMTYAPYFTEKEAPRRAPSGFTAYTPDKVTDIGIYMLESTTAPYTENYIRYATKWYAHFDVDANTTYTVYGYMPRITGMSSSLSSVTSDGATLTINGIKPVTTDDICIITGVKETDEGLKEGQFSWNTPTTGNQTFYINILMDHLYAAAQFRLKIDAEYAALRTIKLKTMTLRTDYGSVIATITLTHNTTGASPISNVNFAASGSSDAVLVFNSDTGTALDKDTPVDINTCFAPTLSNNLTMVTTYDVYDRKGNLIRQNCKATNKLPNLDATRGQKVQVKMTVNPTYLYVLSEPDLDNPTITIGN
jgi:hypothetical protein